MVLTVSVTEPHGWPFSQMHYSSLTGHLIGSTNGNSSTYTLSDAQGGVLTSFSGSAIQGEQLYGPYGNQRYVEGSLGTDWATPVFDHGEYPMAFTQEGGAGAAIRYVDPSDNRGAGSTKGRK